MAKCPKCRKEIDHLINETPSTHFYEFRVFDGQDYPDYSEIDVAFGCVDIFFCPECDEIVAGKESEAIAILKGDKQ